MGLFTGGEIIEVATRLEESGEAFYAAAAEKASTAGIKGLFEELASQERKHRRAFQQMGRGVVELALTHDQWTQFQAYVDALFQQSFFATQDSALNRVLEAHDERDILRAALGFEKETILFFYELREAVPGAGQQTVEQIIRDEKRHIQRLADMLSRANGQETTRQTQKGQIP